MITLAVIGAGSRGEGAYGGWAIRHPDRARVVAVAEPRPVRRERFAAAHGIDPSNAVADWRDLLGKPGLADAVVIATPDAEHVAPAVAFARSGAHILLEKPMAPTEQECRTIAEAAAQSGAIFAVGHVLRYTPYTAALKQAVAAIGDIVSVQHLEPVGFWHQAHSFVRGNWRREAQSSFMLMAKSCHDIDWLCYVVGKPIERVSSFGSLSHFTPANRPEGAAERCLDCQVESGCAYSAKRFYFGRLADGRHGWPLDVVIEEFTEQGLNDALREGPYGRCVYSCDNDVVDHQVVALQFAGGATGTFTMTAFNGGGDRQTRIFGTRGSIEGDGRYLRCFDFLSEQTTTIDTRPTGDATTAGGHGGGDAGLMEAFVTAVATGDRSGVLSGAHESLHTHLAVFAAERARRDAAVVSVNL
jgi:predicted dehydrogenase